jgi:hypothetical protein
MAEPDDTDIADELSALAAGVARRARDAAYVAVGLGVLGLQRARVAQRDLVRRGLVEDGADRLRAGIATGSHQVGDWLDDAVELLTSQLAPVREQLPEPARKLTARASAVLGELADQLRHRSPGSS